MAQLKDTIISGSMRVTDTLYSTTNQLTSLNIPTSSNAVTFGPGTNEQIIKSNGTSVYWTSADSSINDNSTSTNIPTSAAVATFVENKGYASNSIIAPVQSDATADKSYNIDDMFIYDNKLYQATSAISANGVISPNSNCVMVDLVNNISKKLNYANTTEAGVVKINGYGLQINNDGVIQTSYASDALIKAGIDNFAPIVASNQHKAVFYGLAKAANDTTQSQSNNAIGQYTDTAKQKIHTMLGINNLIAPIQLSATAGMSHAIDSLFYYNSKLYKTTVAIAENDTITPNTNCIETTLVDNIVKNTDYASGTVGGVVKISSGLTINNGTLTTYQATPANIKAGTTTYRPIVPNTQHMATFYGLAKAAGDTTQKTSSNAVGTYTDEARAAIINMLGIDKLIGNYQADAYADKTYEIGDLFTMDGKLYKVTAKINQNGVITPNTNCVQTSIIEGLINADLEEY